MPGPVPKRAATRARTNRTTTAATLEAPRAARVELPERPGGWHPRTVETWDVWWASPMVDEWVDADVPGLVELAQLVEDFWRAAPKDRAKFRAEIRMSSREYGLSPMSRRSLQWEVRRLEQAARPAARTTTKRAQAAVLSILDGKRAG